MEKTKNYIIAALFIIIGILILNLKQCSSPLIKKEKIVEVHDSTWTDTVKIPGKIIILPGKPFAVHDSVLLLDTTPLHLCDYQRSYIDSTYDSAITIFSSIKTTGILDSLKISYRFKYKIITTHEIKDTKIVSNKWDLIVFSEVGGSKNMFNTSIGSSLRIKNANYSFRYGLLDKSINIGIGYRIVKSKK